jgi:hypothetical protein
MTQFCIKSSNKTAKEDLQQAINHFYKSNEDESDVRPKSELSLYYNQNIRKVKSEGLAENVIVCPDSTRPFDEDSVVQICKDILERISLGSPFLPGRPDQEEQEGQDEEQPPEEKQEEEKQEEEKQEEQKKGETS